MARENVITLVGAVSTSPTVALVEGFGTYKLGFSLQVLRRNNRTDEPHVLVCGLDEATAKELFGKLRKGAFVIVRGGVITSMKPKIVKCSRCGAEKTVNTLVTEVVAYAPPVILNGAYDKEELREVANNLNIIGSVCTSVLSRCSTNGTNMTQYQIAVSRKYHVAEQAEKTDYPWIKTFGHQADEDAKHLHKGSQIYVNGALQTREVSKNITCDDCGEQLVYSEVVGEIVPYDVEYLANCDFDEESADEQPEDAEKVNSEENEGV